MERPDEQEWRLGSMQQLGDEFARLEEDELAAEAAAAASEIRRRAARRRRRSLVLGGAVVVVTATIGLVIAGQRTSRALAAPNQGAAAAERAGSFAFETRSELRIAGRSGQLSLVDGEVDLLRPGFRVRIQSGAERSGFERIVFPTAVYVRHLSRHWSRPWFGARLSPPAQITARVGSSGGLGDPLGLLAVLAKTGRAQPLGVEQIDGESSEHYRLQLTLGAFLAAERQPAQPAIASVPVTVDVWQNSANRVLRAVRTFQLRSHHGDRLVVQTDFSRYGQATAIEAPHGVALVGSQRLSPLADDPLGASVLSAITFGTEHTTTAVPSRAQ
jgi:hypothetical protein